MAQVLFLLLKPNFELVLNAEFFTSGKTTWTVLSLEHLKMLFLLLNSFNCGGYFALLEIGKLRLGWVKL